MTKRPSPVRNMKKAADKRAAASDTPPDADKRATVTSTLNFPVGLLERLRMGAVRRAAKRGGGRPSVSELVMEILERHGDEIDNA